MQKIKDGVKLIKKPMLFNYTQLTAIEEYLSQMEEKGLRFAGFERNRFLFEKTSERKIRYVAEIFKEQSLKDDFIESCEDGGWEFVDSYNDELYIFRTQNSFACEIMTDEKDKFKTVTKRVLLQPGYLGFSFFAVYLFIKIFFLRTNYRDIIEANIGDCLGVACIIFSVLHTLVQLVRFALWYFKGTKAVKENKIPFLNLKKANRANLVNSVLQISYTVFLFAVYAFLELGYTESVWVFWILGGVMCFEITDFICRAKTSYSSGNILKKAAASLIAVAIVIFGVYSVAENSKNMYSRNAKAMINYEEMPVSLSDFGFSSSVEKNEYVYATKFGQRYKFNSVYDYASEYDSIWYEVFVSDYPLVRENYLRKLKKEQKKYGITTVKAEDALGWDELYSEVYEGETVGYSYAVKDNMIVVLDSFFIDVSSEEFFETALEKLFEKE